MRRAFKLLKIMWPITVGLMIGLVAGCQPDRIPSEGTAIETAPPLADEENAKAVLIVFFDQLQAGDYELAVDLYGGSYDVLAGFNPDIDPNDFASLWRNGCSINGLRCLKTRSVTLAEQPSAEEYIFDVEFSTREGELFVLGPCCGVTETEQPSVSNFQVHVAKGDDGHFRVSDLPPYTP